ncbi:glycoprotein-N-acetylgalactosamine 3-beta-galactosyltransferase 1-like isoform X2 [Asterias amurensis]|uniref:glycoprotein-N-acetylgalactosamine 3-beta-galactosyltransferase 1-like isoform X2 n=1 Tax=Asterias amurensis TaxID=7602 RepID=UPI003AB4B532
MAATSSGNGGQFFGPTRSTFVAFFVAFFWGGFVMYVFAQYSNFSEYMVNFDGRRRAVSDLNNPYGHVQVDNTNRVSKEEVASFQSHTHERQFGQDVVADSLFKHVRILCWILSSPQNLKVKTIHVQATWTRRCNKVIFISSEEDPSFPTVKVDAPEGRAFLWKKTRGAFQYVYDHHLNDADWFLKADDDTYVILENLRYMLADKDPQKPVYYGRKFKPYIKQGYMSGGAGYVLSKAAVVNVVEKAFKNNALCKSASQGAGSAEDVEMGKCLENVGVIAGDSRDDQKRERFHPFVPEHHLIPGIVPQKFWYWDYVYYATSAGPECCSDYSISFHYISPNTMYLLEYMIYHMRPFGIGHYTCPANIDTILKKTQLSAEEQLKVLSVAGNDVEVAKSKEKREAVNLME